MALRDHATTLVLVAAAAAAGAYVWIDRGAPTTTELEARKRNLLPAFRRDEIAAIEVDRDGASYRIERPLADAGADALWSIAIGAGAAEVADQAAVDRLVQALELATPDRKAEGVDRKESGLDAPRLRVRLRTRAGAIEIAVGKSAPAPHGSSYAEVPGQGAYVVPRDLVTQLDQAADAYRGRTIVPYLSTDLARIEVAGGGEPRVFVRGAWGGWRLDGGPRVDRDAFDRLLTAFAEMRAEAFLADADADAALGKEPLALVLVPTDGAKPRARIEIGGACPGHPDDVVVVRREPQRASACAPKGVREALAQSKDELSDRHLFAARSDEMEEIAIAEGDRRLEIARKGESWHERAPVDADVEADAGNGLASTLRSLVAESIAGGMDPAAIGLASPRATVTVRRSVEEASRADAAEVVEVGAVHDGKLWVRRAQDGAVLALPPDAARALSPSPVALRARRIVSEPVARVRRVAVETAQWKQEARRSETGSWTLVTPAGFFADGALASDLADTLGSLTAERWVDVADDASVGLAHPRATLELEAAPTDGGPPRTWRVLVGDPTSGGAYAKLAGDPGVFVLPRAALRNAERLVVDRGYFAVREEDLARATFRTKRGRLAIERRGDRLVVAGAGADAGPDARVHAVTDALEQLRAEAAVHLGPARREEGLDAPLVEIELDRTSGTPERPAHVVYRIGAGDTWNGTSIFYARRDGVDATFALPNAPVRALVDAIER